MSALDRWLLPVRESTPATSATFATSGRWGTDQVAEVANVATRGGPLPCMNWNAEDWQGFFDERAAILEYDHELPRAEAERRALECTIVEWLNRNPEPSDPGKCAWCEKSETPGAVVVPCGTEDHTWLHPDCWEPWHRKRWAKAESNILSALGTERSPTPNPGI